MEAELDVLCVVEDCNKKNKITEFLNEATRPVLDIEVPAPYRDMFNVLDSLDSVEHSEPHGENMLALSWFLGGGDWYTDTQRTVKDLIKAGATDAVAALWLDGQLEAIFAVMADGEVEMVDDIDQQQLTKMVFEQEDIFGFLNTLVSAKQI